MSKFIKDSDLKWLELALANNDISDRPYMELIHVMGSRAYAADGHRMHTAPCKLGDGAYCRYELELSNEIGLKPPVETDAVIPIGFNPKVESIRRARKAFNPASEVTVKDLDNQNGFYGQLASKDNKAGFKRIYVLEALFGMSLGDETILHIHVDDSGENFVYAKDDDRSFVVMGLKLNKENDDG